MDVTVGNILAFYVTGEAGRIAAQTRALPNLAHTRAGVERLADPASHRKTLPLQYGAAISLQERLQSCRKRS